MLFLNNRCALADRQIRGILTEPEAYDELGLLTS
jgi:hypothetical protein